VILRALKPVCGLNVGWEKEPLPEAAQRIVEVLYADVSAQTKEENGVDEEGIATEKHAAKVLYGPRLTYVFPLFKAMFGPEADPLWVGCGEGVLLTSLKVYPVDYKESCL
jgi:hypothetical protein